jgi:hypothetical protein
MRVNIRRDRGALPRSRGRGEQGDTLHQPFLWLRSVRFEHLEAWPVFKQNVSEALPRLDRIGNRAESVRGQFVTMSPCSPRPRKRGSAPQLPPHTSMIDSERQLE